MRHVKWMFVVLFLCSLTSFVEKDKPTKGLNVGNTAPDFCIKADPGGQQLSLNDLKGRYVLLSFWASYDAPSRMRNVALSNELRISRKNVEMVSVSFDEYESIFDETIRKDRITAPFCFAEVAGEASDVYKKYQLKKGFKNYLLNDRGEIIATNISASELSSYIN